MGKPRSQLGVPSLTLSHSSHKMAPVRLLSALPESPNNDRLQELALRDRLISTL